MKIYFWKYSRKPISFVIFLFAVMGFRTVFLNAEESYIKEMEIDSSTKFDNDRSGLPSNPFEIVEMIRRANSLNDATNPSDAIDDALDSFIMNEQNEEI